MSIQKYTLELLTNFSNKNNLKLIGDYKNVKLKGAVIITFNCSKCQKETSKRFDYLINRNTLCKRCVTIESLPKQRKTMMEKYGVFHPSQSLEIRDKIKKGFIEKYGVDNPSKTQEVKDKAKKTNLERYGVEYLIQNTEIKEKMQKTCIEKYGTISCFGNKDIREKTKNTIIKKFGFDNVAKSKEIQEKMKKTTKERYGVEFPLQNEIIADNAFANCYKKKKYIFPSGNFKYVQGYEPFALKFLIDNNYKEDDILIEKCVVPKIWYNDENEIKRRHYVDIFIPSENLCIEVKSEWTLKMSENNIFKKQTAAKELGYNYEIWVYDNKGIRINIYK